METETFSVEWSYNQYDPAKQDAIWFYGDRHIGTATLTKDGKTFSLDIYCDGETKFRIPYKDADGDFDFTNCAYVRYESDWAEHGVTNDAEMQALLDTLLNEYEYEAHIFNSWFDLYTVIDGRVEHLDAVTHTQDDAVSQSQAILEEVAHYGSWEAWISGTADANYRA